MTTYFTADTHFGHANVIRMCGRPFTDAADMDEALIHAWNSRVGSSDDVWHLGDFALGSSPERCQAIFGRLHGRKHLIIGNHDHRRVLNLPWASSPKDMARIEVDGRRLVLCHYAMRSWPNIFRGAIHLYGHTHATLPGTSRSCDVGVDAWAYRPVTLDEISERMAMTEAEPEELARAGAEPAGHEGP